MWNYVPAISSMTTDGKIEHELRNPDGSFTQLTPKTLPLAQQRNQQIKQNIVNAINALRTAKFEIDSTYTPEDD